MLVINELMFIEHNWIFFTLSCMKMKKIIPFIVASFSFFPLVSYASVEVPESSELNSANGNTIHGIVVGVSPKTVTIMSPQGKPYSFSTVGVKTDLKHGLREGHRILVTYKGELKGGDTKRVHVVSISDYSMW